MSTYWVIYANVDCLTNNTLLLSKDREIHAVFFVSSNIKVSEQGGIASSKIIRYCAEAEEM